MVSRGAPGDLVRGLGVRDRIVGNGFLYIGLASSLDSHADRLLADQVHVLSTLLTENPEDKDALEQEAREEADKSLSAKLWIRILGPDGSTIAQSAGMERLFASDAFPAASGVGEAPRPEDRELGGDRPFRVVSALVPLPAPSGARATIQLALDRDPDEDLLARFRVRLAIVCGTSLVFCSAAGFWIARRGLRPVAAITAAARSVSSATLAARIDPARFPRELADLAETFNAMLGRLEESFGKLTHVSADLAHELRTPVNNLRGEIEVTLGRARSAEEYRAVLGSCLEETARLTRIIESLLFLARAESGTDHARLETVELRAELETIVGFYEAAAQEKELILGIAPGPSPAAQVDRVLFQRAVGNVIANAIRATPPGARSPSRSLGFWTAPALRRGSRSTSRTRVRGSRASICRASSSASSAPTPRAPPARAAPASASPSSGASWSSTAERWESRASRGAAPAFRWYSGNARRRRARMTKPSSKGHRDVRRERDPS